jgi:GxxExxY protein
VVVVNPGRDVEQGAPHSGQVGEAAVSEVPLSASRLVRAERVQTRQVSCPRTRRVDSRQSTVRNRNDPIPVRYRNVTLEEGFRADLVVETKVIVELKSVERVAPVHPRQLLTHLRLADLRLGRLINFNVELLRDGIKRVVNGLQE